MQRHTQRLLQAAHFLIGYPAEVEELEDYGEILPYFAFAGIIIGSVSLVLVGACRTMMSPLGQAVIASLALTTLWVALSRGQSLLALPTIARAWAARNDGITDPREEERALLLGQLLVFGAVTAKIAAIGVLVYHGMWLWVALAPVLSVLFTVEMAICHGFFTGRSANFARGHQFFLGITLVACLLLGGVKGAIAAVVIWLTTFVAGDWSARTFAKRREDWINGGAELTEVAVLLIGLALL